MKWNVLSVCLILILFLFTLGCDKSPLAGFFGVGQVDSPSNEVLLSLELSEFNISNIQSDGLAVSYRFVGDTNNNSEIKIFFCSIKQEPGCNPSSGSSTLFVKSGNSLSGVLDLTSAPFSPGDILKYKMASSDPDGLSGLGAEEGFVVIPFSGSAKAMNQLGFISMNGINASAEEVVTQVLVSNDGSIFLAGHTKGSLGEVNAGDFDAFVVKLTSTGALDTSFGGGDGIAQLGSLTAGPAASGQETIRALVADNSGNLYLAGYTTGSLGEANAGNSDAFVAKLTSAGALDTSFGGGDGIAQLGNVTVGAAASNDEVIETMAIDSNGNLFLAGLTTSSIGEALSGLLNGIIIKLNASGVLDTSFGGGDGIAQLGAVSGGGNSGFEYIRSLKLDNAGNIYIAGETYTSFGEAISGPTDGYVAKLSPAGVLDTSFGGGDGIAQLGNVTIGVAAIGYEFIYSMALDDSGNIYLAGQTFGSLGETKSGSGDIFVAKLNTSGALVTSFGGGDGIAQLGNITVGVGANASDLISAIVLDSEGNIYLGGHTFGSLGETNAGNSDAYVAKLTSTGILDTSFGGGDGIAQLGNITVGVGASRIDVGEAMAIDSGGNVYIAGTTDFFLGEAKAGSNDAFVAKLLPTGLLDTSFGTGDGIAQLGRVTVGIGASGDEVIESIAIDGAGNLYLAGHTDGSLGEGNAGFNDAFVAKLTSAGALDTSFGGGKGVVQLGYETMGSAASFNDEIYSIALDGTGNIYLAGYTNGSLGETVAGNSDAFVVKLTSVGALDTSFGGGDGIVQLGDLTVGAGANGNDFVYSMVLDSGGNIYLGGYTNGSLGEANAGTTDVFIIKLNSTGALDTSFGGGDGIAQLGNVTVGAGASGNDNAKSLIIDGGGNIFIGGNTNGSLGEANAGFNDAFVAKLDSTGALDTSFGGGDGIAQLGNVTVGAGASGNNYVEAIAIDGGGNIYLGGYTNGALGETSGGSADAFVAKLDSTGALDTSFGGGDGIAQLGNVTVGAGASGNDVISSMALDGSGNIFLGGSTDGGLGEVNAGSTDGFIAKLNSSGLLDTSFGGGDGIAQLGNVTVGAGASGDEVISSFSLSVGGNIYITGQTTGTLAEFNAGNQDGVLCALNSNGGLTP